MAKLPRKAWLKVFQRLDFELVRQRGSHAFLRHPDGRRLTIPVYDIVPINPPLREHAQFNAKLTGSDALF